MGALGAFLGLLIGGFMALASLLGVAVQQQGNANAAIPAMLLGVGAVVFLPIFYGVTCFIAGIIYAALYNLVAGVVGGIELEFEPLPPRL